MVGTVNINDSASTNPPVSALQIYQLMKVPVCCINRIRNPLSGQNIDVDYATVNGTALAWEIFAK